MAAQETERVSERDANERVPRVKALLQSGLLPRRNPFAIPRLRIR